MRRVWVVGSVALALGCGSEAVPPHPSSGTPTAEAPEAPPSSVAVTAREAPTFARATAGVVTSEPAVPGADLVGPMIARLVENCFDAEPLPADVTVTLSVGTFVDGHPSTSTVAPAGMRASVCTAAALQAVSMHVPAPDAGPDLAAQGLDVPAFAEITVPLHLVAAAEPEPPLVWPEEPLALCAVDADCTTLLAGCGWHPVNARYATELSARENAAHGTRECGAPTSRPEVRCVDLVCTLP